MAFNIVVVDEQIEQLNNMRYLFEPLIINSVVNLITLLPVPLIEDMINLILDEHPDAIIADYKLNEIKTDIGKNTQINYNGADLVDAVKKIKETLPCFIASTYDQQAAADGATLDVNIVYAKQLVENPPTGALKFSDKVVAQIEKYKHSIENKENRFAELTEKKATAQTLNINEEAELIELDNFLERAMDGRFPTPPDLKELSNSTRLTSLLYSVNRLLEEVRRGSQTNV